MCAILPVWHPVTWFQEGPCVVLLQKGPVQATALVAHDCGYPLSRHTCRATRVAADFLDFIAFCRCSAGVALHPLKILVSHLPPPACAGRCRTEIWLCLKRCRATRGCRSYSCGRRATSLQLSSAEPQNSDELWEASPAFQALQVLLPKKES